MKRQFVTCTCALLALSLPVSGWWLVHTVGLSLGASWLLLTLTLVTGLVFVEDMLAQHLWHKTVLSLLSCTASLFGLLSYREPGTPLVAMSWGAEDLSAALGAVSKYDESGELSFTYKLARSLCLAGAPTPASADWLLTPVGE